ncbi:hypothetical protein N482_22530 [Pseudoalteromonas luteoviolacea NCIMB 1942]|uniref:Uncharacterized protein n=2 Tax=Pseudoalteromonas luteoviolacea TaxID=43657 RepID=A0A161YE23_9GAMM|nr:hypothetical protein [Pseudoalteromonas luteoviolacea]KZN58364.1 hypothetical protein N482_22530 [Pseudoalteromonas luteoviolacea NCIMB 1942]
MTRFKLDALKPDLLPRLEPDIVLCSDGHLNYYWLAEKEILKHVVLMGVIKSE